jgi:hypothetical protein
MGRKDFMELRNKLPMTPTRIKFLMLICIVPFLATIIAARQFYLSKYHGLSTWKGGGMGMFASADSLRTRSARIFIVLENGDKVAIDKFSPDLQNMLDNALYYPTDSNFNALGQALRSATYHGEDNKRQIGKRDAQGKYLGASGRAYFVADARSDQGAGGMPKAWGLQIEYWTAKYDPLTRIFKISLQKSFSFEGQKQ